MLLLPLLLGAGPAAAQWTAALNDRGACQVSLHGAPALNIDSAFWGANWKFAGARWSQQETRGGETPFTGEVSNLGLSFAGTVRNPRPNQLVFEYRMTAARKLEGVIGGGLVAHLSLKAGALQGRSGDPELLSGDRGWRWPVGDGEAITVEFAPAPPKIYFERGNKGEIRMFLLGESLPAGTKTYAMTVTLPKSGRVRQSRSARFGPANTAEWHKGLFSHETAPVDLRFLNANEKPAGKRGFVRAQGERLVFADGKPARFWGANVQAYTLFAEPRHVELHARRIAQLGFNLIRLHHHDSMGWVNPTVIDKSRDDSRHLDEAALRRLDYWVKCLKDEGVYVWLDLHVGRVFKAGDELDGWGDIGKKPNAEGKGFCYLNPSLQARMQEFNAAYLNRVNTHTGVAYKDEPAIMGMLISNENDLTTHFGNLFLGDKGNPYHQKIFEDEVARFSARTGLPKGDVGKTWVAGPAKILLADLEQRFNMAMLSHLKGLGVRAPLATTNFWGGMQLHGLPALALSDVIDTHSYGAPDFLSVNPRFQANFVHTLAAAQVKDKPLSVTEWNIDKFPGVGRCAAPTYVASVAAFQGWDAVMLYGYSQTNLGSVSRGDNWSALADPAMMGLMPAAALIHRRDDVREGENPVLLKADRENVYYKNRSADTSAAVRTLMELRKFHVGLPDAPELDWDRASSTNGAAEVVSDLDRDFIPPGQPFVQSDTGELKRDWVRGIQTIDTARTQLAAGWIGGETLKLKDVTFNIRTKFAVVALSSLDGKPLAESSRILLTAQARALPGPGNRLPFFTEPVEGTLRLKGRAGLQLHPLSGAGEEGAPLPIILLMSNGDGSCMIELKKTDGTHWYLLKTP